MNKKLKDLMINITKSNIVEARMAESWNNYSRKGVLIEYLGDYDISDTEATNVLNELKTENNYYERFSVEEGQLWSK